MDDNTVQTTAEEGAAEYNEYEEDAIYPEGYQEGDDTFPGEEDDGETDETAGEEGEGPEATKQDEPPGTDAKPEETPETPEAAVPEKQPETDWKAEYDRLLDQQTAARYRQVYHEQLAATGSDALARMIAANECGGKTYPTEEPAETNGGKSADGQSADGQSAAPPRTDFRRELADLQARYPDLKEMPAEVMREYMGGKSLPDAYAAYRARQDAATIARLRQELNTLQQAQSARAAAPVTAVSGGNVPARQKDLFLEGFDEEGW